MKQTLITVLACIACLTAFSVAKAQTVDQAVLTNYPPAVITKVYDLVVKTNIEPSKQIAIADILKTEDEVIAHMIAEHQPQADIENAKKTYQNSWKAILSTLDQFQYSTATEQENKTLRYSYSLISLALKSQGTINFNSAVKDILESKVALLKVEEDNFYQNNPSMTVFNSYNSENRYINEVFSDEQYKKLVQLKGEDRAKEKAKKDWADLVELGLAAGFNEETVTQQFVVFYLEKDFAYGRYQDNQNLKRKYLQNLYDLEPDAIRKLYYSKKYKNLQQNNKPHEFSQFLFAIRNVDLLGLNESQVKDLFTKANDLEKLKEEAYRIDPSKPYDSKRYECQNLKQILTETQYDRLLVEKNVGKAKNSALEDWQELTDRQMITGHDKNETVNELTNYYMQRMSIYDRYADDQVKKSDLLKILYEARPRALNALIHARRNPGNNTQGQAYIW